MKKLYKIFTLTGVFAVLYYVKKSISIFSTAVSQATSSYIKSLEHQLLVYKRAEEQGRLILLPAAVGDVYYLSNGVQGTFTSKEEIVSLLPEINRTIFLTKTQSRSSTKYVSRSLMEDDRRARLQQNDRDYYQLHKDEVNKKDRDRYHILHPNARYYKKRGKENE